MSPNSRMSLNSICVTKLVKNGAFGTHAVTTHTHVRTHVCATGSMHEPVQHVSQHHGLQTAPRPPSRIRYHEDVHPNIPRASQRDTEN